MHNSLISHNLSATESPALPRLPFARPMDSYFRNRATQYDSGHEELNHDLSVKGKRMAVAFLIDVQPPEGGTNRAIFLTSERQGREYRGCVKRNYTQPLESTETP